MVGVQDKNTIHGARQNRIDLVLLARHGKAHVQEVRRVIEIVARIDERLADRIFEAIAAIVGSLAIMRSEATIRWCGSEMSVES
jgi:hypothetical protein